MKKSFWKGILLAALLASLSAGSLWAQQTGEQQLKAEQRETDKEMAGRPNASRDEALAEQYGVDSSRVQDLRDKGRGWGEINTELAMAEHLSKTDPATYPALSDALKKVDSMRDEGKGWGKIANELGFKLGPVIAESRDARRGIASGRSERPRRPEKVEHPGRPERPERAARPDRASRK